MTDTITLTGFVATAPNHLVTGEGLPITSFRLASSQRRFDRSRNSWVDGGTNWYTVTAFRQLAMNANSCIKKGERVIVTGRLRIREWTAGEKSGTNIEVDADAIGHDLGWGTAAFTRSISSASLEPTARTDGQGAASVPREPIDSIGSDWPTASPGSGGVVPAGESREAADASAAVPF
jgi:single-strand DNA-binding protein